MSVSSFLTFKFYEYTKQFQMTEFLRACDNNHWKYFSNEHMAWYLSIEDDDGSGWENEAVSESRLHEIMEYKQNKGEIVGISIIKFPDNNGCNVIYHPGEYLLVSLGVYRRVTDEGITDVTWYLSEMKKLFDSCGYQVESIEFNECR